ncbi:FAD-dependent oxidoreductase [Amycolatopsis nigrescens]|uniref:FAD-dependent oxidoreductase n=1 Tax=Amycolatopsis nigrescens TaxID=381445 RepID=UPI00036A3A0F|nr:FAD-dependent oxidoreductase [Amycolatopsis nigrescens]
MPNRRDFLRLGAVAVTGVLASAPAASGLAGTVNWDTLRRNLSGRLVLPSDAGYEYARQSAIQQFDSIRPQAVAYCVSEQDVRTVLRFAQDNALPAVPRSGGHSFGGYSTTQGVILDVSRLNHLGRNGPNVVLGPGVQQVDALKVLSPLGLSLVGGTCPTVCAGGFIQGGGIGFQTRKHGLAADRLVSASVVLANGRLVRASEAENPDLFWALRGNGGGNYGVVTGYEVRPTHVRRMVNFNVMFPWDKAGRLIAAFQPWAVEGPTDLAASLTIIQDGVTGGVPQVGLGGVWHGPVEEFDRLLEVLIARSGARPISRAVQEKSYFDAMMEWYGCTDLTVEQCHRLGYRPEAQLSRMVFNRNRNRLFAGYVPESNVDRMLEAFLADPREGQFRLIYLDTFGGEANVPARTATAFVHRTSKILAGFAGALNDPDYTEEQAQECEAWLAKGFATLEPNSQGESYQNFFDPALPDWRRSYYAENYDRLVRVGHQYDPDRFFRFARSIG